MSTWDRTNQQEKSFFGVDSLKGVLVDIGISGEYADTITGTEFMGIAQRMVDFVMTDWVNELEHQSTITNYSHVSLRVFISEPNSPKLDKLLSMLIAGTRGFLYGLHKAQFGILPSIDPLYVKVNYLDYVPGSNYRPD